MKMISPLGDLYVTINEDVNGRPFEVFCTLGKAGGAANADAEAVGRLMSLALRSGIPIAAGEGSAPGHLLRPRGRARARTRCSPCPTPIGQAIERYLQEKEGVQEDLPLTVTATQSATQTQAISGSYGAETFDMGTCPDCGTGHLAFEEGCKKCHICGYSECG